MIGMQLYPALATCIAIFVYIWTFVSCGNARRKFGIKAPATTGHPEFERYFRIQQNTLEQLVPFLPSLWLFSTTVSPFWGGILGLIWSIGRIIYGVSYARDPETRAAGFGIGMTAFFILLIGATLKILWIMITGRF